MTTTRMKYAGKRMTTTEEREKNENRRTRGSKLKLMNNFMKKFMVLAQNKHRLNMVDNKIQISQSHLMMK